MDFSQTYLQEEGREQARRALIASLADLAALPDARERESCALLDEMAQLMLTARGTLEPHPLDRGCTRRYLERMVELGLDEAEARCGLLGPAVVRGMILHFDPQSGCSILFPQGQNVRLH